MAVTVRSHMVKKALLTLFAAIIFHSSVFNFVQFITRAHLCKCSGQNISSSFECITVQYNTTHFDLGKKKTPKTCILIYNIELILFHANQQDHKSNFFLISMSLLNIRFHSCHISLFLLSLPPTACSLSPWQCWVSVALSPRCHVLLLPCHSAPLPVHRPVCYTTAWAPSNVLHRRQDPFFFFFKKRLGSYNPLNQIRKMNTASDSVTDDHDSVSGWNGKPQAEPGWDSHGGNQRVSFASVC